MPLLTSLEFLYGDELYNAGSNIHIIELENVQRIFKISGFQRKETYPCQGFQQE